MGSDVKVFGVNRLVAGAFFVLSAVLVSLMFLPGAIDWVAHAELHGKLSLFSSWEPRHRLFAGFTFTGLFALSALVYLRWLIDNRMVFMGTEGIEVRHPLGTQRALWRDLVEIKQSRLIRGYYHLIFRPGRDGEGRRMTRKVRLPAPMLGVDLKGMMVELTMHFAMKEMAAAGIRPPEAEARATFRAIADRHIAVPAASRTFGKRR